MLKYLQNTCAATTPIHYSPAALSPRCCSFLFSSLQIRWRSALRWQRLPAQSQWAEPWRSRRPRLTDVWRARPLRNHHHYPNARFPNLTTNGGALSEVCSRQIRQLRRSWHAIGRPRSGTQMPSRRCWNAGRRGWRRHRMRSVWLLHTAAQFRNNGMK